jgi:RecB family exonuclease
MTNRRVWLDWCSAFVPAAAEWLVARASRGRLCDLGRVWCVTPGRRACRLLLLELIQVAQRQRLRLAPPILLTPGDLAEALATTRAALATDAESTLAWMTALRSASSAHLDPLLAAPPAPDEAAAWHELAATLARVHQELGGGDLRLSDVAALAEESAGAAEARRWRALARIQQAALDALTQAGLRDPAEVHREALQHGRVRGDADVILVGVTDLNPLQRRMLAAAADRVIALVAAPQHLAHRFDNLGCVIPGAWSDAPADLDDAAIVVADRPCDQAQAVLRAIAAAGAGFAPDDLTVALGDEGLASTMIAAGRFAGLELHHAAGTPLLRTAPLRLLAGLADWLDRGSAEDVAALARHADLEAWLRRADPDGDLCAALDRDIAQRLPSRMTPSAAMPPEVQDGLRALDHLLAPLRGGPRPLASWCDPILSTLRAVYQEATTGPRLVEVARALLSVMAEMSRAPDPLQPRTTGAGALRILLQRCGGAAVADEPGPAQVEMVGWLEVPFDSAPLLVVSGMNDGFVPRAGPADPWLPDLVRRRAGLACDETRLARDAWILEVARHARARLTLVAGRRDADGEPLTPSRLLLRGAAPAVARRLLRLCDGRAALHAAGWLGAPEPAAATRFTVPAPPQPPVSLESLPVTAFRKYLHCPYRFWLGVIERLRAVPDDADELDALGFGDLIHRVLHRFALDERARDSDDPAVIGAFLEAELARQAAARFGGDVRPAVRVQMARIADRFAAFARAQAEHRASGWRIEQAERPLAAGATLDVPGQDPLRITGTIDRIDRHPGSGAWLIIDYKTGDKAATPEAAHRRRERWTDLQLPLYHHLARLEPAESVQVAYFNLPRAAPRTRLERAGWSGADLEDALACARQVVRDIRAGRFAMSPDSSDDAYDSICQVHVRGAPGPGAEGDDP